MNEHPVSQWAPPTRIRPAALEEVQLLCALECDRLHGEALSANRLRRLVFKDRDAVLVFERRGRLLGYAVVLFPIASPTARLHALAVASAARGRGIARALVAAAEGRARDRGRLLLRLELPGDDGVVRGLYRSLGYYPFGLLGGRGGEQGDAVRFEKRFILSSHP